MPDVSFDNLLVISVIAVLAPLLAGAAPRLRIPAVVLEIVAGIIVGPTGFGWVRVDLPIQILALFGLAFLLFLAGLEIDLMRLRGQTLAVAAGGYAVTLALGLAVGGGLHALGWVQQPLLIAVALSATSLGLVVPVLKDAAQSRTAVGQTAIAAATVADFAAIVVLSFFFSTSTGSTGAKVVLLIAFAALIGLTAFVVMRAGHSMRLGDLLVRLQDTTA
ncbi:MAG: cation:proton antiporter, partial [Lapillicoccus sp.]